jgi:hypothetical protein
MIFYANFEKLPLSKLTKFLFLHLQNNEGEIYLFVTKTQRYSECQKHMRREFSSHLLMLIWMFSRLLI